MELYKKIIDLKRFEDITFNDIKKICEEKKCEFELDADEQMVVFFVYSEVV